MKLSFMKTKTIVITAGGSGGHVVPASVLCRALTKECKILFFTDKRGLRFQKFIPKNIEIILIPSASLGGKNKFQKIISLSWTVIGMLKTFFLFLKYRPSAVVGFGGYASFPACIIGGILRRPVILHEQNMIFGKTNRILSYFASISAISFKNTRKIPKHLKTIFTGLPLREELTKLDNKYPKIKDKINILITGGSQGASFLNTLSEVFCSLPQKLRKRLSIVQQVVDIKEQIRIKRLYKTSEIQSKICPFISNMPKELQNCHLFIGSSGSMVLEVQQMHRPMLLIPLKISAENHQGYNAREIEKTGGAKVILEKDFEFKRAKKLIEDLIVSPDKLVKMSNSLVPHDGAKSLTKLIKGYLK